MNYFLNGFAMSHRHAHHLAGQAGRGKYQMYEELVFLQVTSGQEIA